MRRFLLGICPVVLLLFLTAFPEPAAAQSVREWRERAESRQNDVGAWLGLATAAAQARNVQEAMRAHDRAVRLRPTWDEEYSALGLVLLNSGFPREALKVYQAGVARDPQNAKAHADLANAYRDQREWEHVIASYEAALALKATDEQKRWWLEALAQAYTDENRYAEARLTYAKAAALAPDDFHSYEALGQSYYELDDFVAAEREFRRALALGPDPISATRLKELLTSTLLAQGEIKKAAVFSDESWDERQDELERRSKQASHVSLDYEADAHRYREEGDLDSALRARRQAIDAEPDEPWHYVRYAQDLERAGRASEAMQAYGNSIPVFRAKLEGAPKRKDYYRKGLALALRKTGATEETVAVLRVETAAEPDNAVGWIALGDALAAEKRYAEAVQAFARVEALAAGGDVSNHMRMRAAIARGKSLLGVKRSRTPVGDAWQLAWNIYHAMTEEEQILAARERAELERFMPEPQ